jgi:hypothetical protein
MSAMAFMNYQAEMLRSLLVKPGDVLTSGRRNLERAD